jgi:hypothetical protein
MRIYHLISALIVFPLHAFGHTPNSSETMSFSVAPMGKNTVVITYSNQIMNNSLLTPSHRTFNSPTQIIRMVGRVEGQMISCDQVIQQIETTVIKPITTDKFIYNTMYYCTYDPDSKMAIEYGIKSYFDPINEQSLEVLNKFLAENNGTDLMGTNLSIESAKGVVLALNLTAGFKKNLKAPPFIQYRKDRGSFFFKNNYEMRAQLFADVEQNFYSNDPEKVLPFLDRWLFDHASILFAPVLRESNHVELQPEVIFLMNDNKSIFVSSLKYNFIHDCTQHDDQLCLRQR